MKSKKFDHPHPHDPPRRELGENNTFGQTSLSFPHQRNQRALAENPAQRESGAVAPAAAKKDADRALKIHDEVWTKFLQKQHLSGDLAACSEAEQIVALRYDEAHKAALALLPWVDPEESEALRQISKEVDRGRNKWNSNFRRNMLKIK